MTHPSGADAIKLRAFRCWLPGQPDLRECWTLAASADHARSAVARSAAEVCCLPRASPHLVRCVRAPEHDRNPSVQVGHCSTLDHVKLGTAAHHHHTTHD